MLPRLRSGVVVPLGVIWGSWLVMVVGVRRGRLREVEPVSVVVGV